ncbi:MAG: hypothetical protein HYZ72_17545 [Deltaproteobacteria bacterium]|nr:hypothetical protein [Deltaproteobacteria bacterium]
MIVDFKGRVISRHDYGAGSSYCGGVIDIEALRDFRARSPLMNWMKDLRTELLALIYEQPLYPKNLWLTRTPMQHAEYKTRVTRRQIRLMQARGIFTPPGGDERPGAKAVKAAGKVVKKKAK